MPVVKVPHNLPARYLQPAGEPNFAPSVVEVFVVEGEGMFWRYIDQSICHKLAEGAIPDDWKRVREKQPTKGYPGKR
jgi:hypothetical protein